MSEFEKNPKPTGSGGPTNPKHKKHATNYSRHFVTKSSNPGDGEKTSTLLHRCSQPMHKDTLTQSDQHDGNSRFLIGSKLGK